MRAVKMEEGKLAVGSVSPKLAVFQSIAQLAPLPTLILTVQEIFGYSNAPALSYLIALIITLFGANTIVQMGRRFPHAGGYYAYVANGISKTTGIYAQFVYLFYQILNTAGAVIFGAWVLQTFLETFDIYVRGYFLLPIILVLILMVPYFGIKPSAYFYLITASIEIAVVALLGVFMLAHPAPSSNFMAPFVPSVGISSFALSIIYSLFFFTGYGSMLTIAEETKDPKRSIPLAAILGIVGIGILEFFFIYASQINWGTGLTSTFASSSVPPTYIASERLFGAAGLLIVGTFMYISLVKGSVAIQNATSRALFALSRDGIISKIFSRVHKRYRSPTGAIIVNEIIAALIISATYLTFYFVLNVKSGITEAAAVYIIALLTIGYLIVHVFANMSVPIYFTRKERKSLSIVKHYLFPIISTVAVLYALALSFTGLSGYMLSLPVAVGAFLVAVLIFVIWLKKKRPEVVIRAGEVIPELSE